MPNYFSIPLQVGQPQRCQVTLGQVPYRFTLRYRNIDQGGWFLDIADQNGNPLVSGIPLVTGADLLAQYPHLNFGGKLIVATTSIPDAVPTFENLGADAVLYWVV